MPKITYLQTKAEKQSAEIAEKAVILRGKIGQICFKYRISQRELAAKIGMPKSTFSTRMHNPEKLTLGDIWKLKAMYPDDLNLGL